MLKVNSKKRRKAVLICAVQTRVLPARKAISHFLHFIKHNRSCSIICSCKNPYSIGPLRAGKGEGARPNNIINTKQVGVK